MNHLVPPNSWAARDLAALLHPYTDLHKQQEDGPLVMVRGKGVHVQDSNGIWYLEGMAGLWSASLGRHRGDHGVAIDAASATGQPAELLQAVAGALDEVATEPEAGGHWRAA